MNKARRGMAVGVLLLLSTAGVAVAQNAITCDGGRCEGTDERDVIVASTAAETVIARAGDDDVELDAAIVEGSDDVAYGGRGRDCIDGGAGDDLMVGGADDDNRPCEFTAFVNPRAGLTAGPGDDRVEGGSGDDSMDGIADDDTLIGDDGNDLIEDLQIADSDRLLGGRGDDSLNATDGIGNDLVDGGLGTDDCSGDMGDTFRNCETGRPNTAPGDTTLPRATVSGVRSRGCLRGAFGVRVSVSDAGGLTRVSARQDARVIALQRLTDATEASFAVRAGGAGLRAGRHRIVVRAQDDAGNRRTTRRTFRVCGAGAPRLTG